MNQDNNNNTTFSNKELTEQFFHLQSLMHKYHHQVDKEYGSFGNPNHGQERVLALLKLQPKATPKELSYLLNMRSQSLGELLSNLEKNGYITHEPSEKDHHVMTISLTKAGLEVANKNEENKDFYKIFNVLNQEEKVKFSEFITRLSEELDKHVKDDRHNAFRNFHHNRLEMEGHERHISKMRKMFQAHFNEDIPKMNASNHKHHIDESHEIFDKNDDSNKSDNNN